MARRLKINSGDAILEPSAGEGVFIDAILKTMLDARIDALGIGKNAVSLLKEKYRGNGNVAIREADGKEREKAERISSNQKEGTVAECKAPHLEISKMVERVYFAL